MAEPRRSHIEALRKSHGLKRSALAKQVGISYKHVWGIERGEHTVADETLQLIANALRVHISELVVSEKEAA